MGKPLAVGTHRARLVIDFLDSEREKGLEFWEYGEGIPLPAVGKRVELKFLFLLGYNFLLRLNKFRKQLPRIVFVLFPLLALSHERVAGCNIDNGKPFIMEFPMLASLWSLHSASS